MYEVLRRFVVENIWCTPDQDYQSIYKPQKITPKNGVFKHVRTLRDQYRLPTDDQYHVFQIGQVPPKLLGIDAHTPQQWHSLAELMNANDLIIDAYTLDGQQFPRFATYLMRTTNRNVLVAVPRLSGLLDLNEHDLYLRFYSNAYFASDRFEDAIGVRTEGRWVHTVQDRNAFQAQFNAFKDRTVGHTNCVVNGTLIKVPSDKTIPLGAWAEFVYDASVAEVIRVPVSDLRTFDSVLDGVRKHLLHLPKSLGMGIVFKDDLDIQLFKVDTASLQKGTYYHQNRLDSVRMLTHQDYALPVSVTEQYATQLPFWDNVEEVVVEVHVRHSGYARPLTYEHQRLHELYKLSDTQIVDAMLGSTSAVVEWRAEHLENAAYPKIMRAGTTSLDPTLIRDALGYNAIGRITNLNPVPVETYLSEQVAPRPPLSQGPCLALEYDANRWFLGGHPLSTSGVHHYVQNPACEWVEFYPGIPGPMAQCFLDEDTVEVTNAETVRLYKCPVLAGEFTYEWVEANEGVDYTVETVDAQTRRYTWTVDATQWGRMALKDTTLVYYEQQYPAARQTVKFTLGMGVRTAGVWAFDTAKIPLDFLQLTLNGYSLVEGVDYTLQWPEVVIHNKQALDPTRTLQDVSVLMMGIPEDINHYTPRKDTGFVQHGRLSRDQRFQVREDRPNRIISDGRLLLESEVLFAEGDGVNTGTLINGRPYSVRTPPVPVGINTFDKDRVVFRDEARDLDDRLSAWLSTALPEPTIDGPNLIPSKHVLVSPLLAAVLYDMQQGVLDTSVIPEERLTDVWLYEYLEDYLELLDFDPAREALDPHVAVHPHGWDTPVTVTRAQFNVLTRTNYLMLGQRVELHETLRVGA